MQDLIFYVATLWLIALFGACIVMLVRARSMTVRILVLDTITMILIALLTLASINSRTYFYLDAALILALLSFVATLATARYHGEGNPFA